MKYLKIRYRILSFILFSLVLLTTYHCDNNREKSNEAKTRLMGALALTPPMGWNSWNMFNEHINEQLIMEIIDAMVSSGMKDAGYEYVILDDGWQRYKSSRMEGTLEADPEKFPHGIKYLADYCHSKGLKFGIYSGPGNNTCAGYAGSLGHEMEDAKMWASWGVDYLKYDSCCEPGKGSPKTEALFDTMAKALQNCGRNIVLSVCHCGWDSVWQWAGKYGQQWRIGQDIADAFDSPGYVDGYYMDILDLIDRGVGLEKYSGPGGWNDYDMLVVGLNGKTLGGDNMPGPGCTPLEYRTHFSMWCILSSPLIAGNDLRNMDAYTVETLTNKEVIALNQDSLGIQAAKKRDDGDQEIFAKPLADGSWAVALLNRGTKEAMMTINFKDDLRLTWSGVKVRDLWLHRDMGLFNDAYTAPVLPHEAVMLKLVNYE